MIVRVQVVELQGVGRGRDAHVEVGAVGRETVGEGEHPLVHGRRGEREEVDVGAGVDRAFHRAGQAVGRGGAVVGLRLLGARGDLEPVVRRGRGAGVVHEDIDELVRGERLAEHLVGAPGEEAPVGGRDAGGNGHGRDAGRAGACEVEDGVAEPARAQDMEGVVARGGGREGVDDVAAGGGRSRLADPGEAGRSGQLVVVVGGAVERSRRRERSGGRGSPPRRCRSAPSGTRRPRRPRSRRRDRASRSRRPGGSLFPGPRGRVRRRSARLRVGMESPFPLLVCTNTGASGGPRHPLAEHHGDTLNSAHPSRDGSRPDRRQSLRWHDAPGSSPLRWQPPPDEGEKRRIVPVHRDRLPGRLQRITVGPRAAKAV